MSDTETGGRRLRRCPLWARLLLLASLAGNLVVIGWVGGWMVREPHDMAEADGLDRAQARLLRLVPEDEREGAREVMLARSGEMAEHREKVRDIHREIAQLMRSPTFDAAALRAKLDLRRQEMSALFSGLQDQMVTIVDRMTPKERAEMADRLDRLSKRLEERNAR